MLSLLLTNKPSGRAGLDVFTLKDLNYWKNVKGKDSAFISHMGKDCAFISHAMSPALFMNSMGIVEVIITFTFFLINKVIANPSALHTEASNAAIDQVAF